MKSSAFVSALYLAGCIAATVGVVTGVLVFVIVGFLTVLPCGAYMMSR